VSVPLLAPAAKARTERRRRWAKFGGEEESAEKAGPTQQRAAVAVPVVITGQVASPRPINAMTTRRTVVVASFRFCCLRSRDDGRLSGALTGVTEAEAVTVAGRRWWNRRARFDGLDGL
jgi:hypothetical protein